MLRIEQGSGCILLYKNSMSLPSTNPPLLSTICSFLHLMMATFLTRYTGHFPRTVLAHPQDAKVIVKGVGALLVIGEMAIPIECKP